MSKLTVSTEFCVEAPSNGGVLWACK